MATLDDIIEAKNRHCLRRARALCKIYSGEMYGETTKAREAYERLKAEFGLEGLDKKKR
jgi:hypothetical protein